ncbi:MAG: hypothetical protein K2K06_02215 [Oscillospiraceae bacterium]|nr:hypothetical protein [Oscillospiraceae bacterium]
MISGQNGMLVDKSSERFFKLESSIYVLLSCTEKMSLRQDIENAGQKDKKSKRKE